MQFVPETDGMKISELIEKWSGKRYELQGIAENFAVVSSDCSCEIPAEVSYVISCGLSAKATVTVSSVDDEGCVCCVQREFENLSGEIIEPQEFYVRSYGEKPEFLLFAITANLIINGIFF